MLKRFAALLAALAVLVGCAQIKEGTVTDKSYSRSWTETIRDEVCTTVSPGGVSSGGGQRICTPTFRQVHHPERFSLRLKNIREEGWRTVPLHEYEMYAIGDQYP